MCDNQARAPHFRLMALEGLVTPGLWASNRVRRAATQARAIWDDSLKASVRPDQPGPRQSVAAASHLIALQEHGVSGRQYFFKVQTLARNDASEIQLPSFNCCPDHSRAHLGYDLPEHFCFFKYGGWLLKSP